MAAGSSSGPQTITVAVVNNPQMADIQKLTKDGFEKSHPKIHVKYVTLDENTLRDQVTKDVAAGGGQFDVVMIGPYEVPTWAQNKWIVDLTGKAAKDTAYKVDDLIKPIRDALSVGGKLYALPFYGESSFLMYRTDLLKAAGLTMPAKPTWDQVAAIAAEAQRPVQGAGRDLLARQDRLGREPGAAGHGGQHLRWAVVRHQVECAPDRPRVQGRRQLLREPDQDRG